MPSTGTERTEAADWLVGCVAELLQVDASSVTTEQPLADFGLDSVTALAFAAEIEDHFGVALDPDALWVHPSIDALLPLVTATSAPVDRE